MKILIPFMNYIQKTIFFLIFLVSSTLIYGQNISTVKTVTLNANDCNKIDVQLKVTGDSPINRPLEIVLVIDISGSMNSPSGTSSLTKAKIAAKDFIDYTFLAANNPTGNNKIAIVAFGQTASIKQILTSNVTNLKNAVNNLIADGTTNLQDGIVKAHSELVAHGNPNCSTARSIILLTDGATNRSGTDGSSSCNSGTGVGSCAQIAVAAANAAKTITFGSDPTIYTNQFFSIAITGGISGNDITTAQYTLDNIQSGGYPAIYTASPTAAELTQIYNEIFTKLSWTAKDLKIKETDISGYTIAIPTNPSKGIASISGGEINWNIEFLNVETITLNYTLTKTGPGTACGNQIVSKSSLNYTNSLCLADSKVVITPSVSVPCEPIIANKTKTACSTEAFTLTPTTGNGDIVPSNTTYSWAIPVANGITGLAAGSNQANINGTLTNTTNASINVVYTVTPKSGNCTGATFTVTVTVNPKAVASDISATGKTICTGLTAILDASSPVSGVIFKWYSDAALTTLVHTGVPFTTPALTTTTTYYISVTGTAVCENAPNTGKPITVTVNPEVTLLGAAQANTVCAGSTATINLTGLLASSTSTVAYTINGVAQTPATTVVANAAGEASFTSTALTAANNAQVLKITAITNTSTTPNCSKAFNIEVPLSVSPATVGGTVSEAQTICYNTAPANLTLTGNTGTVVKWQKSTIAAFTNPIDIPGTSTTLLGSAIGNLTANTYFRAVVKSGSCPEAFSTTVLITVNPEVTLLEAAQANTVCAGSTATINLTGLLPSSTSTVAYTINGVAQTPATTVVANAAGEASFTSTALTAANNGQILKITAITNTSTTPNCSKAFSIEVTLSVSPATVGGTVSEAQTICYNTVPANLTLTGNIGTVVKWQKSTIAAFTNPIDIPGTSTTLLGSSIGNLTANTYFRAVVKSGSCPEAFSTTVLITVNPEVTLLGAAQANTVCAGSTATIKLTGLLASSTSTVAYTINSVAQTPVTTVVANAAGEASFTSTALTAANNGQILKITAITNTSTTPNCSKAFNIEVTLSVSPATVGGTVSAVQTICYNTAPATLTLTGNTGAVVKWQKSTIAAFTNPIDIPGTSTTLLGSSIGNLTANTYFRAVVKSGSCPEAFSTAVLITVNPEVTLLGAAQANTVCAGSTATINLTGLLASSTSTVAYTINGVAQTPATTVVANAAGEASFTSTALTAANNGQILKITAITNTSTTPNCSKVFNIEVTLSVSPATDGGTVSGAQTICYNTAPATLTLTGNTGAVVKWQKSTIAAFTNPIDIPGTSTTLLGSSIGNLTANTYFRAVVKSGSCPEAFSTAVLITVNPEVTLLGAAQANTVCAGSTATINLTGLLASSTSTVAYTINGVAQTPVTTVVANAAGEASFTSTALTAANNGQILKITAITNTSTTSNCSKAFNIEVTLSVNPETVGGTVSEAQTICYNTVPANLTLTGNTGAVVKWQKSTIAAFTNPIDIPGTSTTLLGSAIGNLTANTYFRAVVKSGSCPEAFSTAVLITVNPEVTLLGAAQANTVCASSTATINLTGLLASSTSTVAYTINGVAQTPVTTVVANAAGEASFTSTALTAANNGQILKITAITNTSTTPNCSKAFNIEVTLSVNPETVGGTVSEAQTICYNTVPANLTLTGNTGTVVKWQKSTNAGFTNPIDINVQSTTLLGTTIGNLTANTYIRAIVQSGTCPQANLAAVLITVNPEATLLGAAQANTVCAGSTATINLTGLLASSTSTVAYTINGVAQTPVTTVVANAAGEASFTSTALTAANNGQILKITAITNTSTTPNCSKAFNIEVTLSVNPETVGGTVSEAQTICYNTVPANLTLTGNTGAVVKWQKSTIAAFTNPIDIPGTSTTLLGSSIGNLTANTYFRAVVKSGSCPEAFSTAVLITVNPEVTLLGAAQANTVCAGSTATINLTGLLPSSTSTVAYTINSVAQTPVTTVVANAAGEASFTSTALTATNNGQILKITAITNRSTTPNCSKVFNIEVTLSVSPATVGGTVSAAQTICYNTAPADLTLTGNTGAVVKWQKSTIAAFTNPIDIPGTSTTLLGSSIGNLTANTYFRAVVKSGSCPEAFSTAVLIIVNPEVTLLGAAQVATVCAGSTATINLTGLLPSSTSTVAYTINSVAQTPVTTVVANAAGEASFTSTALTATNNGQILKITAITNTSTTPNCSKAFNIEVTLSVSPATDGGTVSAVQTICYNTAPATLTLTGNTGAVVKWQKSTIAAFTNPIDIPGTSTTLLGSSIGNLTANTYFRAVVKSGSCPEAFSTAVLITVNPEVTLLGAAQVATVCAGSTATINLTGLLASSTSTVAYTINGVAQTPATTVVANAAGEASFTSTALTAANNGQILKITAITNTSTTPNCSKSFSIEVTLSVNPETVGGTVSEAQTICYNTVPANLTLTGNTGTVVKWQKSTNAGFTNPIDINVQSTTLLGTTIGNLTANTYIRAIVQSGTCPEANLPSVLITVNPTPTITKPADQTVCNTSSTTLVTFSGTATSYSWTNNNTSIGLAASGTGNIPVFTATNTTTGPISATITVTPHYLNNDVTCDGISTTFVYTVNPTPTITKPADQTVCNTGSSTLVTFSGTATSYSWTNNNTSIGLGANGTGNIPVFTATNTTTAPISGTITVTPHYLNNSVTCDGTSTTFVYTVNPTPTITKPADQTVCNTDSTTLVTFSGTATSYSWTNNNTSIGLAATGTGNIPVFTATNTTTAPISATITVTPHYLNNDVTCDGISTTFVYNVNPTPTVNIVSSTIYCNGASATAINFSSPTSGGTATFAWTSTVNVGFGLSGTTNIPAYTATNSTTIPVTATINVRSTINGCEGPTTTFEIKVNPLPKPVISGSLSACSGDVDSAYSVTNVNGNTYSWSVTGGSITDGDGTNSIKVTWGSEGTGTVNVTEMISATNCLAIAEQKNVSINSCLIALKKESQLNNSGNCTAVDDTITYTFTVTNPGTTPITSIKITDPLFETPNPIVLVSSPSGDTNNDMKLDSNEIWIYTATYFVTQKDIDAGNVTNHATVKGFVLGTESVTGTSSTVTALCQNPKITIVKTNNIKVGDNGCAALVVGSKVKYTFTVTNSGNTSLHNVTIKDPLFEAPNLIVVIGSPTGDSNSNSILEVTESWIYNAIYTVTQADLDAGKITNQAIVNGTAPDNTTVVNDKSGSTGTSDDANVIPICTDSAIAIIKTNNIKVGDNGCATLVVGSKVKYTFTVTNSGNTSLHNVTIKDPLFEAPNLIVVIGSPTGDTNSNSILEVTESWIYNAIYTVTQADLDAGKITNQAIVNGTAPDNTTVVNDKSGSTGTSDDANVIPICTNSAIAIIKTNNIKVGDNGCAALVVGSKVKYTFTVTNSGNTSLHNVTIKDPLFEAPNLIVVIGSPTGDTNSNSILEVTESWIYNAIYTVTQADLDAGKITNQAIVNGTAPDNTTVVNDKSGSTGTSDDANVIPICTNSAIAIIKTNNIQVGDNGCATLVVGNEVKYTFTVTNTGNTSLYNVKVIDNHTGLSTITLLSGDTNNNNILEVSEIWIYTATYVVVQADIDAGKITNQASVNGTAPNNTTVVTAQSNNNTPNIITICTKAAITVTKDGVYVDTNKDGVTNVGDHIAYSFVVTNTGNLTLTNVTITDSKVVTIGAPITLLAGTSNATAFSALYPITQSDIDKGYVYNMAFTSGTPPVGPPVTGTSTDPTPCKSCPIDPSCPDCTITPLTQNPSLKVDKNAATDASYTFVGDVINYTIQVTNNGNLILHQIVIKDPLTGLDTTIASLIPGAFQVFNVSYTVTKNDLQVGSVTNIATATGLTPKDLPINASDTEIVDKSIVLGCGTILVHNAFSPNGDGINEVFVIDNIGDTNCYPDNTVEIYNRWGILVFETKNYSNTSNYFNGISRGRTTISQSSGLPSGVYFYILKYTSVDNIGDIQVNQKDGYLYLTK